MATFRGRPGRAGKPKVSKSLSKSDDDVRSLIYSADGVVVFFVVVVTAILVEDNDDVGLVTKAVVVAVASERYKKNLMLLFDLLDVINRSIHKREKSR
jgi:hypothetical protein